MMRVLRPLTTLLAATAIVVSGLAPAQAQEETEAQLGGGSDIPLGVTIRLPQGGSIPPIHAIFADNPADEAIQVEFRADTPAGIHIEPEWDEKTIPGHDSVENHFTVEVGPGVAPGQYPVVVQLVRSDIETIPGRITNIPAIQAAFTVEVAGEAATVTVRSVSALSGEPVTGTLTLAAVLPEGDTFELARVDGSSLEADVAPGQYRAAFLLGERELAAEQFTVGADQQLDVVLEVETVSFVLAAIRPVEERGRVVVVDLVASVNNEAAPIPGPAILQTNVFSDGTKVDTAILSEVSELPAGITEATTTYRPQDGWQPGTYRFVFELVTPAFTLTAPDQPTLEVPTQLGFDLLAFLTSLNTRQIIALAAGTLLGLVLVDRLIRWAIGRRHRRRHNNTRTGPARQARKTRRAEARPAKSSARRRKPSPTSATDQSWLMERIGPTTMGTVSPPPPAESPRTAEPPRHTDGTHQPPHRTDAAPSPLPPAPPKTDARDLENFATQNTPAIADNEALNPATRVENGNGEDIRRIAGSLRLIQHLHDEGTLAPEWSISEATLVYWAVTSHALTEALDSVGMNYEEYTMAVTKLFNQGLIGRPPQTGSNPPV